MQEMMLEIVNVILRKDRLYILTTWIIDKGKQYLIRQHEEHRDVTPFANRCQAWTDVYLALTLDMNLPCHQHIRLRRSAAAK